MLPQAGAGPSGASAEHRVRPTSAVDRPGEPDDPSGVTPGRSGGPGRNARGGRW
ncbi:hypothetical protein Ae168Ps1_0539 [Pseudonocardia sp. Ae168_Ps1]|nr:hypothetical protein Ae168Ps1_0539 [Pseudonocardia sp. Ae168_Ps1]